LDFFQQLADIRQLGFRRLRTFVLGQATVTIAENQWQCYAVLSLKPGHEGFSRSGVKIEKRDYCP